MTLCPVALALGCVKCPIFKACPAKRLIGDYVQPPAPTAAPRPPAKKSGKRR